MVRGGDEIVRQAHKPYAECSVRHAPHKPRCCGFDWYNVPRYFILAYKVAYRRIHDLLLLLVDRTQVQKGNGSRSEEVQQRMDIVCTGCTWSH
jgi:hypothetical protein